MSDHVTSSKISESTVYHPKRGTSLLGVSRIDIEQLKIADIIFELAQQFETPNEASDSILPAGFKIYLKHSLSKQSLTKMWY